MFIESRHGDTRPEGPNLDGPNLKNQFWSFVQPHQKIQHIDSRQIFYIDDNDSIPNGFEQVRKIPEREVIYRSDSYEAIHDHNGGIIMDGLPVTHRSYDDNE